jgi:molecular chaperone HtpG
MADTKSGASAQTLPFKTELKQLLDIIVHSLYSEREIFLRELVSNACDAIDKARFEALTDTELLEGDDRWKIRLAVDHEAGTLTVSDNGVGMSEATITEDLGTIARSGTQEFLARLQQADAQDRPSLIGQFGVGFYSAFMVADEVTVVSRPARSGDAVRWTSNGQGEFTIERAEKSSRGTDVILHLKEDAREFLDETRLRAVVKKYSDFIEHPIVMDVPEGEGDAKATREETLNSRKALWLKSPSEVKPEEYADFYKQVARDLTEPAKTIHFSAEGTLEFRALLFLPRKRPLDFHWGEPRIGVHLYVQRVFIMDECEGLLPLYLRFTRGIVDSSDLPLNVSRELLQQSPLLAKIRKALVNKILRTLADMKEKEYDDYVSFYREFGATLKEGLGQDWENKEALTDLMLVESTKTEPGEFTTLAQVVERMPEDQESIYYLIGETRASLENSPYVEAIRARDREVLLLTDPVDEFVMATLPEYGGKKLQAADRGEIDVETSEEQKQDQERYAALCEFLDDRIEEVRAVRISRRLQESAACLVADDTGASAHLERLMARMGRAEDLPASARILELNGRHPAVEALLALFEKDRGDPRIVDYARLLYDEAVIAEGSAVADPAALAQRINRLIEGAARD